MNLDKNFQVIVGADKESILEAVRLFKKIGRTPWREEYVTSWCENDSNCNYVLCSSTSKDKIEWNKELSSEPLPVVTVDQFRKALLKRKSLKKQLKQANSKLGEIDSVLQEYYTGSYTTIEELAGEISAVLYGEDND